MKQPDYAERLLEIHGSNMWNGFHVERAIEFAKKFDLTGIIFHCNDLVDKAVRPDKYFPPDVSLLRYNNRDGDTKNYKYYLGNIIDRITAAGLAFYAETKELYYPHELLEEYPRLRMPNGAVCPADPFWREFLEEKIDEFVRRFPGISGVIVSAGTRESMVSLAANKCNCGRCRATDMNSWYRDVIGSMFRPLKRAGKKLVVRDFSYTADHQFAMVEAAGAVSEEIVMALKKVPHDYYPTFPDNPTVGNCGKMTQWIEYDTWGQYFGLGVIPCSVAEDMQGRMRRYLAKGAGGVMLRTDWERLLQGSVFNSFSLFNLVAGAMLSKDVNVPLDSIYKAWLAHGLVSPLEYDSCPQKPCVPQHPAAAAVLQEMMKRLWLILERAIYVRGHVFNRNVQMFDRYFLAYFIMTVQHTRDHWDPGASQKVEPTDANMAAILAEKDEAVAMAKELRDLVKPKELGVSAEIVRYLEFLLDAVVVFAEIFKQQIHSAALTRKAEQTRLPADVEAARGTLAPCGGLAERLSALIDGKGYPNGVEYVFDSRRVLRFAADIERVLGEIKTV